MVNITTPIPADMIDYMDRQIGTGEFDNRSQFVRKAIRKMIEEKELTDIFEATNQIKNNEFYTGDLETIIKNRRSARK